MNIRAIKTDEDYRGALELVQSLIFKDPESGTPEYDQLEILSILIEDFERKQFPFDAPDPISAIEFRMEEQGLKQRDLIPMLGSRSRVSEVLARRRPLTLQMIRSISEGLKIPAEILVKPILNHDPVAGIDLEWSNFPVREMMSRGWLDESTFGNQKSPEFIVKDFLARASKVPATAFFRRKLRGQGFSTMEDKSKYSTFAWTARILERCRNEFVGAPDFNINCLSNDFLYDLAKLSALKEGPLIAIEKLRSKGICVVIEPKLSGSLVDGAALLSEAMRPVIGLTLRYDRADYFWFTLFHEIIHVWKHLNSPQEGFVDLLDSTEGQEQKEKEANKLARDALIPKDAWLHSVVRVNPSSARICEFASEIGVHPAIVAGRVRFESGSYNRFNSLVGQGTIRKLFSSEKF